jgi:CBS domain-containing protein
MVIRSVLPNFVPGDGISVASYAVVGAAGFIGGVTHITVSITVIMLEISNDLRLLLPIMLTTGVAKFMGDMFTHSLYDMILEMKHIPFLEPEPNVAMMRLRCFQVMKKPVVCLPAQMTVGELVVLLRETHHNGFPVVEEKSKFKLLGIISRGHLEVILENINEFLQFQRDHERDQTIPPPESASDLKHHHRMTMSAWKQSKSRAKFELISDDVKARELDISIWMNRAPVSVRQGNRVDRAFQLFKTFGLRQLPVVNSQNELVGILTRHDVFHVQHHPDAYEHQAAQHTEDFSQMRRRMLSSEFNGQAPPRAQTAPLPATAAHPGGRMSSKERAASKAAKKRMSVTMGHSLSKGTAAGPSAAGALCDAAGHGRIAPLLQQKPAFQEDEEDEDAGFSSGDEEVAVGGMPPIETMEQREARINASNSLTMGRADSGVNRRVSLKTNRRFFAFLENNSSRDLSGISEEAGDFTS